MKKKIFLLFSLIFIFLIAVSPTVSAFEFSTLDITAKSAILISLDTNAVIYEKNADVKAYPASITKIVTTMVVMDRVTDLENTVFTYTEEENNLILGTYSSVIGLKVGEQLSAKDTLAAMLISSGGDAIYCAVLSVCDTVEEFVTLMNNKVAELGLTNTHFSNPVGLHDEENYTTARDIAVFTRYCEENYPYLKELMSSSKYTLSATNMSGERLLNTTNSLINPTSDNYYAYAVSGKTGFTDEAGRCLVSTASYNGYNYLCVLLGEPNVTGIRYEFIDARAIYKFVFNNFEYKSILDTANPVCEIGVKLSFDTDSLPLYPETQISAILPKEADSSTLKIVPHPNKNSVTAPVKQGDVLGTADIYYAEQLLGSVNLVAGINVKSNFLLVAFDFLAGVFSKIVLTVIGIILLIGGIIFVIYSVLLNKNRVNTKSRVRYVPYNEERERKKEHRRRKKELKERGYEPPKNVSDPDPDSPDYFDI